ncbi:hypothetical protein HWV62_35488 [Athelia sp. TMB]|nr:hypothetical protein HWV62_35488 [Athelia sp. TMB]
MVSSMHFNAPPSEGSTLGMRRSPSTCEELAPNPSSRQDAVLADAFLCIPDVTSFNITAPESNPLRGELKHDARASQYSMSSGSSYSESSTSSIFDYDLIDSRRSSLTSNDCSNLGDLYTLKNAGVVYTILGVIGEGGFGEVLQAESSLGGQVAIKSCMKAPKGMNVDSQYDMILTELDILQTTTSQHQPFLTQPLATFQDERNVYFVMNLYSKDLAHVLFHSNVKFTAPQFKLLACELLLGIETLHKLGILHRDLKPDNVLVTPEGHLAVADYGLAVIGVGNNTRMHDVCGTPGYTAPEMIERDEYGLAVDIWGFGIILFEMYTGKPCMTGNTTEEIRRVNAEMSWKMRQYIIEEIHDQELAEVLSFAMACKPEYRATWEDFRELAFFRDV